MRRAGHAVVVGLVLALASCGIEATGPETSGVGRQEARAKAERAATALMQSLGARLTGALRYGTAEDAIAVCSEVAQELTDRIGAENGVTIRRTALRVRNPANRPDEWERAWLTAAHAESEVPSADHVEVVEGRNGEAELRFLRPIRLKAMCLVCHGEPGRMHESLLGRLAALYPQDEATGYDIGDLRGAVSIRVPFTR